MRYTFNLKKSYDDYYLYGDTVYGRGEKPTSEYVSPYKENWYIPEKNITKRMCYNKLGQYEDIEDKLGIDLIVYHKLMEMLYCGEPNILYVKDNDKIVQVGVLEIDYCKKKLIFYKDNSYNDDYVYGFSQYGKRWAFTKEELINEKEN